MKTKINSKRISELIKHKNIKVVSIDTENMLYTCDDGNEYPLIDELETLPRELDEQIRYIVGKTYNVTRNHCAQVWNVEPKRWVSYDYTE